MCPGRTKSVGLAPSPIAVWIVFALSAALIPVVIPSAASMLTVKAVSNLAVFSAV